MSKLVVDLPLSQVEAVELYVVRCREPLSQVAAKAQARRPDCKVYLINGGMWNRDGSPCPILKADGALLSETPWGAYGYGWDQGPDITLTSDWKGVANFLSCTCLIGPWGPVDKPSYDAAQGGTRGRSGLGLKGDCLRLMACQDGTGDARTPERLRDDMAADGCSSFVMGDGGGSAQAWFDGAVIPGDGRKCHNYIVVYVRPEAAGPDHSEEDTTMSKYTVCLDPGHGPGTVNGSPDGSYKEHEFAWDIYERISKLLEARGVHTICTRTEDAKPSLTERAGVANRARATCFVSLHSNAAGNGGWYDADGLEIYTSAGPMTAQRNILATDLVNAFHAAGVVLRSTPIVHSMDLTVLTKTDAPAVLIEYGFHTSKTDVELLKSSTYRDKLATATAAGVCKWLGVSWADGNEPPAGETDRTIVQRRFGFADETMDYLCKYQYADALLERLATAD